MPAADSFWDCVAFGILGSFQRVDKCWGPEGRGRWLLVIEGGRLGFVSSYDLRRNKRKEIRVRDFPNSPLPSVSVLSGVRE